MKRLLLAVLLILVFGGVANAQGTYNLCVGFDYDDNPQLNLMRDWAAYGMNYQDTVDDGSGNQIPNPVSKLAYIKANIKLFVFQNMRRGELLDGAQTVVDDHMTAWDAIYESKVVDIP